MLSTLTTGEKKVFVYLLDMLDQHLSAAGCNDLPKEMVECLTREEWIAMDKAYHELNGDPKEHNPECAMMMDISVLYYLRKKLGL